MTTLLLDTNIVSYLFKQDSRMTGYQTHLINQELAISLMTVAELFQWAALRNWGAARIRQLESAVHQYTLLPIDIETCRWWAHIRAHRASVGIPISPQDAWIAATARRYDLVLVTHNPLDFRQIDGLTIITEA